LRAWHYFQQLLGALASAHALGIVHRDVKPQNLLLRRDGLVKLTDFGIAKVASAQASPTKNDVAPGTGAYMSPEQVLSLPVDGRSDLYSAAIVLYETLSGRLPFPTENRSEFLIRQDQVERAPPLIRTYLPHAPPIIDALFARALAKKPEDRFSDAIAMGTAFRNALGLPDSEEWRAQAELARAAIPKTLDEGARHAKVKTLRDFLAVRYQTVPLKARPG
jgi:serine/threonine-protein kinase